MASPSPHPNSPPAAIPPASSNSPPPLPSPPRSTPSEPSNAPPPQLNSPPPTTSPPPQSSPPTNVAPPPPALPPPPAASPPPTISPPPQPTPSPPPANTPPSSSSPPPPSISPSSSPPSPPPPPPLPNPPASSPPPPASNPPASSTPPPSSAPASSPPSPSTKPPINSPPSPSSIPSASPPAPPKNDPPPGPPPSTQSPESSSPPPSSLPPVNSSTPPLSKPPQNSPPQPAAKPPQKSLPPPAPISPESSPPPPALVTPPKSPPPFLTPLSPYPPASPPSSNSPQRSPPPPIVLMSPPPPPPSLVSSPTNNNNSSTNASESSQSAGGGGIGTGGTIAIVSVLFILLLSIFALVGWCIWKRKKKASALGGGYIMPTSVGSSPKSDSTLLKVQISTPFNGNGSGSGFENSPGEPGALGNSRSWFTYEELVEATNGFSGQNLLGEGGFGSVYKGCLADGRLVAVKQLKIDGGQGEREFRSEVEIISRIHHRHLVSLVGYCISENRRLLVYDYVPNNSLYFHLHGEGRPVISWATRVRIAVGAARGIAYLHEDCHPRIIHRDIKSSNILLDNNFEARVSDFGLAKLATDTNTHVTTRVMGTFGYMAPEYATSGKLTDKSDVFSYGVVVLELITGRKPVDTSQPLGEESLVEWARPLLSHALETGEFERLADSKLEGNYVDSEMFRMIETAAVCVRHSAAKRPKMGQVVRVFDSMATSDLTNGMKVGESAIFNSAQQSAEIRLFRRMAFGSQNYSTDFFSKNSSSSEGHLENSR